MVIDFFFFLLVHICPNSLMRFKTRFASSFNLTKSASNDKFLHPKNPVVSSS